MTNNPEVGVPDFASELDFWIAGGSVTRRSVEIHFDGAVLAEIDELTREYDLIKREQSGEASLTESIDRIDEINERLEALADRYESSGSTWVVRALVDDDFDAIRATHPEPTAPKIPEVPAEPNDDAPEQEKAEYREALGRREAVAPEVAEYEKAAATWADTYNLEGMARAVVEIRWKSGRVDAGVTVEQLRAIRAKYGTAPLLKLQAATTDATDKEPVIPAPFSRGTSQPDLT